MIALMAWLLTTLYNDIRADMAELKAEVRSNHNSTKADMAAMEGRLKADIHANQNSINDLRIEVKADITATESRLGARIDRLGTRLDAHAHSNMHLKTSPSSLTKQGKELTAFLNAQNWVDRALPKVLASLPKDADPLRIQQASIDFAKANVILREEEAPIRADPARKGKLLKLREQLFIGGDLEDDVIFIYGLLLRDAVLALRNIQVPAPARGR